jgi:hypothetical protein
LIFLQCKKPLGTTSLVRKRHLKTWKGLSSYPFSYKTNSTTPAPWSQLHPNPIDCCLHDNGCLGGMPHL